MAGLEGRVALITGGVASGVVHDLATAREAQVASTGHAVPAAWRFGAGPSPGHLLVGAGEASEAELIAECGRGLYVQRLDYVRVLRPGDVLVTGSSRDSTLWIEGGKAVANVPQFRFTASVAELLRGVLAIGMRFGAEGALYLTDWITGWDSKDEGRIWKLDTPATAGSATRKQVLSELRADFRARPVATTLPVMPSPTAYLPRSIDPSICSSLMKRAASIVTIRRAWRRSAHSRGP